MSLIKNALQKQIQNSNLQQCDDATATILEYNAVLNTAKIRFANPNGEGYLFRDNVRISNTLGGLTGAGIYPGQLCSITFLRNDIYAPMITGLIGSNYAKKTNSDQGAYLVDCDILQCEKPEMTPLIDTWIEPNNTNPNKYNNDLKNYIDTDVAMTIHQLLNTLDKYKDTEQGITSLDTKSTIKTRENGDIDIFVANNIGIRISKADKSISLYGTIKVNGEKIDLSKIFNDSIEKE